MKSEELSKHPQVTKYFQELSKNAPTIGKYGLVKYTKKNAKLDVWWSQILSDDPTEQNDAKQQSSKFVAGGVTNVADFRKALCKSNDGTVKKLVIHTGLNLDTGSEDIADPATQIDAVVEATEDVSLTDRIKAIQEEIDTVEDTKAKQQLVKQMIAVREAQDDSEKAGKLLDKVEDELAKADEELNKEPLQDPKRLKLYLKMSIKKEQSFAYGLIGSDAMLTMYKGANKGPGLARKLKKTGGAKKASFGTASLKGLGFEDKSETEVEAVDLDNDDLVWGNATLVLKVAENSKALPGMLRQLKKWAKSPANPLKGKLKKVELWNESGQISLSADEVKEALETLLPRVETLGKNLITESQQAMAGRLVAGQAAVEAARKSGDVDALRTAYENLDELAVELEVDGKQAIAKRAGPLLAETKLVDKMANADTTKYVKGALQFAKQNAFNNAKTLLDKADGEKIKALNALLERLDSEEPNNSSNASADWKTVREGFFEFIAIVQNVIDANTREGGLTLDGLELVEIVAGAKNEMNSLKTLIAEEIKDVATVKSVKYQIETNLIIAEIRTFFPEEHGDIKVYDKTLRAMHSVLDNQLKNLES